MVCRLDKVPCGLLTGTCDPACPRRGDTMPTWHRCTSGSHSPFSGAVKNSLRKEVSAMVNKHAVQARRIYDEPHAAHESERQQARCDLFHVIGCRVLQSSRVPWEGFSCSMAAYADSSRSLG